MTPEQAQRISGELLDEAERMRAPGVARVTRRRLLFRRFLIGAAALLGYAVGLRLTSSLADNPFLQQGIAAAIGLLAALLWPPEPKH